MYSGPYVFSQILECVRHWEFRRLAQKYGACSAKLKISAWEHFLAMAFAQLTYRDSLRDIEACLHAHRPIAYHLGFRHAIRRSTLAHVNEHRSPQLFEALSHRLMARARGLYCHDPYAMEMDAQLFALDATMIDLSVALCPWANWTGSDAAVKVHTLLDLHGPVPAQVKITSGNVNEMSYLEEIIIQPGAYYLMDRGYLDLERLRRFHQHGAFFLTRERADLRFKVTQQNPSAQSCPEVISDQVIHFVGSASKHTWPLPMRRLTVCDAKGTEPLALWTNHMILNGSTLGQLYRQRWRVEIFFRWIKQNLRIDHFYGLSPNAVRVQLWCCIATYLAAAIARKEHKVEDTLSTFLQVVSISALQQIPIKELFAKDGENIDQENNRNQLLLNGI
jgi:hypothetical protein